MDIRTIASQSLLDAFAPNGAAAGGDRDDAFARMLDQLTARASEPKREPPPEKAPVRATPADRARALVRDELRGRDEPPAARAEQRAEPRPEPSSRPEPRSEPPQRAEGPKSERIAAKGDATSAKAEGATTAEATNAAEDDDGTAPVAEGETAGTDAVPADGGVAGEGGEGDGAMDAEPASDGPDLVVVDATVTVTETIVTLVSGTTSITLDSTQTSVEVDVTAVDLDANAASAATTGQPLPTLDESPLLDGLAAAGESADGVGADGGIVAADAVPEPGDAVDAPPAEALLAADATSAEDGTTVDPTAMLPADGVEAAAPVAAQRPQPAADGTAPAVDATVTPVEATTDAAPHTVDAATSAHAAGEVPAAGASGEDAPAEAGDEHADAITASAEPIHRKPQTDADTPSGEDGQPDGNPDPNRRVDTATPPPEPPKPSLAVAEAAGAAEPPVAAAPVQQDQHADAPTVAPLGIDGMRPAAAADHAAGLTTLRGTRATPHAPAGVPEQISVHIRKNVSEGNDHFTIQLRPVELGRVDIRLEIGQDGKVSAMVAVDKVQTLELLQRDSRNLERALQDAGLSTDRDSLSFSLRDDNPFQSSENQGGQRGRSGGRGRRGTVEDDVPDVSAAYTMTLGPGRVDVRV